MSRGRIDGLCELENAVEAWFAYLDADETAQPGDAHLEGRLIEAMRAALAKAHGQSLTTEEKR